MRRSLFFIGLVAGIVDAIPGVSGGTVYYLSGIYQELLEILRQFSSAWYESARRCSFIPLKEFQGWQYLAVLGSGVLLSFILSARFIVFCLQDSFFRPWIFSVLFGIVLGSSVVSCRAVQRWIPSVCIAALVGLALGFATLCDFRGSPDQGVSYRSQEQVSSNVDAQDGVDTISSEKAGFSFFYLFRIDMICIGIIVLSVTLLPGISGTYILYILGYYEPVVSALFAVLSYPLGGDASFRELAMVVSLLIGIGLGIGFFARVLLYCFRQFPFHTQAFLFGCMLGSVWSLWPFQVYSSDFLISSKLYFPSIQEWGASWYLLFSMVSAMYGALWAGRKSVRYYSTS